MWFKKELGIRQHNEFEIVNFEVRHGIQLPEEYKDYLLKNRVSGLSRVLDLDNWSTPDDEIEKPSDFLRRPFPHLEAWNEKSLYSEEKGWESEYYADRFWTGAMRVYNLGCEAYAILVISGTERGNIWIDGRAAWDSGIYPVRAGSRRISFKEFIKNPDGWLE